MRIYNSPVRYAVKAIAVISIVYALLQLLHVYGWFNVSLYQVAFRSLFTGLALALVFLTIPATKKAPPDKLPWYDAVLALIAVLGGLYPFLFYKQIALRAVYANNFEIALGTIMILTVFESVRRTAGWALVFILLAFSLYGPYCDYLPGMLQGVGYSWPRVIGHLYLFEDGMFGLVIGVISTIVVAYLLFGEVLFATGVGKFLTDISYAVFGRFAGGPAKGAVVASGAFGMISGSPISDVVITGSVNIPLMIRTGYSPVFAGAVEAVSSTGGALMPPVMGSVAFIMAEFLDISYADVCIAAAWPAILYYLSIFLQVHFRSRKRKITGRPVSELPSLRHTLLNGWQFFFPLGVLIYLLLIARYEAVSAAMYAIAATFLIGLLRKETRVGPRRALECLEQTGMKMIHIVPVCAGAGIIVGTLGLTGLGVHLSSILVTLAAGNLMVLLLITGAASVIMAMGIPWTGCYILLALLVAPTLEGLGIVPKAAHLFLLYMGLIAFITPPICIAVHSARAISGTGVWPTGLQAVRFGIVAYLVPFLFVFNPALILEAPLPEILFWTSISIVVVFALAASMEGYIVTQTGWFGRVLLFVGAVLLPMPQWTISVPGGLLIAAAIALNLVAKSRASKNEEEKKDIQLAVT